MKLVGVVTIGTYFSPFFPYTLASLYEACDELVVANHGFILRPYVRGKTGNSIVGEGPLELLGCEAGRWIGRELLPERLA